MTEAEIRNILRYHIVDDATAQQISEIRDTITAAMVKVAAVLPMSRERSLFISHMQEGEMNAIASLAVHGRVDIEDNLRSN